MSRPLAALPLAFCLIALTGCGDDTQPAATATAEASSKVIEGTISDEMLPLATLKSQPPLMAEDSEKPAEDGVEGEETATGAEPDDSPESAATPAATPAATSTAGPAAAQ